MITRNSTSSINRRGPPTIRTHLPNKRDNHSEPENSPTPPPSKRSRRMPPSNSMSSPFVSQSQLALLYNFGDASEMIKFLQNEEDSAKRRDLQIQLLEKMLESHNGLADHIEALFNYIQSDNSGDIASIKLVNQELWIKAIAVCNANENRRNRGIKAKKKVLRHWDAEIVEWLIAVNSSAWFMTRIRALANKLSSSDGARCVNRAFLNRLSKAGRGFSAKLELQPDDFSKALALTNFDDVTSQEMKQFGLRIGQFGFLEEGLALVSEDSGIQSKPESDSNNPARANLARANDASSLNQSQAKRDFSGRSREIRETPSPSKTIKPRTNCVCSRELTSNWKSVVTKEAGYEKSINFKLLKIFCNAKYPCYDHSRAMASCLGLRTRGKDRAALIYILHCVYQHRDNIGKLKTDAKTYQMFRVKNRPARPEDGLGPYKFIHTLIPTEFKFDSRFIQKWVGVSDEILKQFTQDGSMNLDIFGWWFKTEIGAIVLKEFDMYNHHLQKQNGIDNHGWLRNMSYSIGQQLMRQDPMYYCTYAASRPDSAWRLVTYPHYAKFAKEGDETYFRHINFNVRELIQRGRGGSMIQGSVSLDDEDESNCTVILAGMHTHIDKWWAKVKERGQERHGLVHCIKENMFTKEDAKEFGIDWKATPCKRGEARITLPQLPHGSDGPTKSTRRTMLPWFVHVQDDLSTLEIIDAGSWEMLSQTHRDMVAPIATPSGLENSYGAIPYKFPAAVEISGLGHLSNALVCARRWDSLAVLHDRDILLLGPREIADEYIKNWRATAVIAAVDAFELMVQREKDVFGERSYFYHLDRLEKENIPFPVLEADVIRMDPDAFEDESGDQRSKPNFAEFWNGDEENTGDEIVVDTPWEMGDDEDDSIGTADQAIDEEEVEVEEGDVVREEDVMEEDDVIEGDEENTMKGDVEMKKEVKVKVKVEEEDVVGEENVIEAEEENAMEGDVEMKKEVKVKVKVEEEDAIEEE
ncbi:hypothetical protein SBOR_1493 [Sclerotinia borealis F-4128]|uniref:Uncharacterized protein n=1 Tax=Sclerotinia borealis (strain F-4128) TaxID=1432307 RepID=W9CU53_SCLBF|nr:hypothetical protein SBOR_1493 [Sclerotinia borealis F-4128]